jgi:hypothetical protein
VKLAAHLKAPAVNLHCVDGGSDPAVLDRSRRMDALERAVPYLEWYVSLCRENGITPLIENVPPICRMRRAAIVYSPIGVEWEDLAWCCERVPGLGLTLDTSHAQLAVNAFRGVPADETLSAASRYYASLGSVQTLEAYVEPLLPWIVSAHISNASGLLDEGMPYAVGDADLDGAVRLLARSARYFVTEPLDQDEEHAVQKREVQAHLERVLAPLRSTA